LDLMRELELEYPENPLIGREIKRAQEKLNKAKSKPQKPQ